MKTEFKHQEAFSHIMKVEKTFHENMVFIAGFGNQEEPRSSSMMAYGTIIDFIQFDKTWEEVKDDYSINCWLEMVHYWASFNYLSPISKLFSSQILHKIGKTDEDLEEFGKKGEMEEISS